MKNSITGIDKSHYNPTIILAAWNELFTGQTAAAGSTPDELATAIWSEYQKLPRHDLIRCNLCAGIASEQTDVCPYCGHDSGEPLDDEPVSSASAPTEPAPMTAPPSTKAETKPAKAAKAAKQPKTPKTNPEKEETAPMPVVTEEKNLKPSNGASTAIAKASNTDLAPASSIRTERELDDAVRHINALKSATATNFWELGRAIGVVHADLWKLRTERDDNGKAKARWSSFDAFCKHELGFTPQNARSLMDISAHFSKEQAAALGSSKLDLIMRAPEAAQPAILARATAGASKKEIAKAVREESKKAGHARPARDGSKRGTANAIARQKGEEKGKRAASITVAAIVGSQTITLHKKDPAMKKTDDWSAFPRAKRLADQATGRVDLANGVYMTFEVKQGANGDLAMKVETKRQGD